MMIAQAIGGFEDDLIAEDAAKGESVQDDAGGGGRRARRGGVF